MAPTPIQLGIQNLFAELNAIFANRMNEPEVRVIRAYQDAVLPGGCLQNLPSNTKLQLLNYAQLQPETNHDQLRSLIELVDSTARAVLSRYRPNSPQIFFTGSHPVEEHLQRDSAARELERTLLYLSLVNPLLAPARLSEAARTARLRALDAIKANNIEKLSRFTEQVQGSMNKPNDILRANLNLLIDQRNLCAPYCTDNRSRGQMNLVDLVIRLATAKLEREGQ